MNRALPSFQGGSDENTLTVPFRRGWVKDTENKRNRICETQRMK